jgi:Tol biopolymer transport system component
MFMVDAECTDNGTCNSNWIQLTNTIGDVEQFSSGLGCHDQITASPDGKYIAFAYRTPENTSGGCFGGWDIYAIILDECQNTKNGCPPDKFIRLTDDPADDSAPAWSPDGKSIAFISNRGPHQLNPYDIYIMNTDGSGQRRLLNNINHINQPYNLDWSPDGKSLVVSTIKYPQGNFRAGIVLYLVNSDGSDIKQLLDHPFYENQTIFDLYPQWSPDGRWIVFDSNRSYGGTDLYMINADGSELTKLTDLGGATEPYWSPDGEKIAFLERMSSENKLFMIDGKGGQVDALINSANIFAFIWIK